MLEPLVYFPYVRHFEFWLLVVVFDVLAVDMVLLMVLTRLKRIEAMILDIDQSEYHLISIISTLVKLIMMI